MATELTVPQNGTPAEIVEKVVVQGDLSKLSAGERLRYYGDVCRSLNLNPLTKPFEYLHLSGKLVLYATRTATDQLAQHRNLSLQIVRTERVEDVYVVTARATGAEGRSVENVGAVKIGTMTGDSLANALMKATTKAYRRATLSYCGLGWLEESEVETIGDARTVQVDHTTGEIVEPAAVPTGELPCDGGDHPIRKGEIGGKTYSPTAIANWSHRKLGRRLCLDCVAVVAPELLEPAQS